MNRDHEKRITKLEHEIEVLRAKADAELAAENLVWHPMETFPKDGTRCSIEFASGNRHGGWFWGHRLMGEGYCIRGDQAEISPYLKPLRWAKEAR